jgi:hypothetical protein
MRAHQPQAPQRNYRYMRQLPGLDSAGVCGLRQAALACCASMRERTLPRLHVIRRTECRQLAAHAVCYTLGVTVR